VVGLPGGCVAARHALRALGRRRTGALLGLLIAALALALWLSPPARAADCSLADQSYNGACGPQFELPAWGDGAGWKDPSKYSTIQLADLTGNGKDELIARNDDGIEIWTFDTTVGQWRPAIGADGQPEVLTDFRSPLPSESGPNWNQPQYYSTIQTADLYGNGAREILARFPDGMRVYQYTPPAGTKNIKGGTWSQIAERGPFSDKDGYANPSLYLTIHAISATRDQPGNDDQPGKLVTQTPSGPVVYDWSDASGSRAWFQEEHQPSGTFLSDPANYLDMGWATLQTEISEKGTTSVLIQRSTAGITTQAINAKTKLWEHIALKPSPSPFADVFSGCSGECFGSSPSYYETLRFANIDGGFGEEMLGRLADGLHVWKLSAAGTNWLPRATLTDLKGSAQDLDKTPGRWASIRTGDILGNGRDQVLALDGNQLQAWSYDHKANAWTKLKSATPLQLGGDMWDKNPSYYSTIQVGPVAGPGFPDAVIARGPYGIRTWFYNLHGSGGWTSWLPQDTSSYPQFTGGQAAAFAALTSQAKSHGAIPSSDASVRDAWTAENAPTTPALAAVRQAILGFAGCSGATNGNPPYTACTPPAGSSGFTAVDWTTVVNQVLTEAGLAQDADDFFSELDTVRQKLFIAQGAELDAIAAKLGLSGAAGNETKVNPQETTAGILKIIGAIAGAIPVVGHVLAAPLEVAGELTGLLASDSPTLNSEFTVKYADLKEKFATIITEIDKGLEVQSQEVRSSYGLLSVIAQLTTGAGPWSNPDLVGLESADNEGFALWSYQQLLPTMYARYAVTGCPVHLKPSVECTLTGPGPETIGAQPDFTTLGPPPTPGGGFPVEQPTPCNRDLFGRVFCHFSQLHDQDSALATKIWGPLSDTCKYQPGNAATKWTFGCNLGVNKNSSVSLTDGPANGWDFQNYCGNPDTSHGTCAGANASATVGANSRVTLTGSITLPQSFRVTTATIAPDRLLYEPAGPDGGAVEVIDRDSGRPLGMVRMARLRSPGDFADPSGGVRARLELGKTSDGQRSYDLSLSGVNVMVPDACQALPAADALSTPPFSLTSTLELSDGAQTHIVSLPAVWRCVRDSAGVISELSPTAARALARRPGLAVSLAGPRVLGPGANVTYQMRVHNRRRGPSDPLISSLWHVLVQGSVEADSGAAEAGARPRTVGQVTELRRGRSRTLPLRVRVPRSATGRICIGVTVTADSARPAAARICTTIARPARVGLG
jgi:hypothetical protein